MVAVASPTVPNWNRVVNWLREVDSSRQMAARGSGNEPFYTSEASPSRVWNSGDEAIGRRRAPLTARCESPGVGATGATTRLSAKDGLRRFLERKYTVDTPEACRAQGRTRTPSRLALKWTAR